ncbi:MAG: cobaltochelatase subunit CobN [Methylocystaceae bacterium]|nr:cobaltochelatase subunit CobN [Methylocystaceae bacterium]
MHLQPRDRHSLDENDLAIDIGQTPAEIVFLSFSDSELRLLAHQHESFEGDTPTLRCASLRQLKHPYSIDLYIEKVLRHAKLIVVRLLGGKEYWSYGVEQLEYLARTHNISLAIVPGDIVLDERLAQASTLEAKTLHSIWNYFQESGPENLSNFLRFCAFLIDKNISYQESQSVPSAGYLRSACTEADLDRPIILLIFYRSLYLSSDCEPIISLSHTLSQRGFSILSVYVTSLKDPVSEEFILNLIKARNPDLIINTTAFSARKERGSVLEAANTPILQVALALSTTEAWLASQRGANAADLAMNVVLPEVDGRIFSRAISFKETQELHGATEVSYTSHKSEQTRLEFVADLAQNWINLRGKKNEEKKLALVLSDYPGRYGRCGYALGLDTPASAIEILKTLQDSGYRVDPAQIDQFFIKDLENHKTTISVSIKEYESWLQTLPNNFQERLYQFWGPPHEDPAAATDQFIYSSIQNHNIIIALQPDRGNRLGREDTYHNLDHPPRHAYVAFYLWLRFKHKIDALVHLGTHGTLEWLPGKSVFLSQECDPEIVLGPTPLIYPFIVTDPGEAAHAKRRSAAVIISHLTPKLMTPKLAASTAQIETLLDEYSQAVNLDPRRAKLISAAIIDEAKKHDLFREAGVTASADIDETLSSLDKWLCDLKEIRIGDGLHIFGTSQGDDEDIVSAKNEKLSLLTALEGKFIEPGPGGAPSRGRKDVLPTGRNLFCIDPRHTPTHTAYEIGKRAADEVIRFYLEKHGDYPKEIMLDLWGSATIRTGGEDFAQALALLGVKPLWDTTTSRIIGFEIIPQTHCSYPRVAVTLHVSGLFRDMFPSLIALFDDAVKAVANLDEEISFNPLVGSKTAPRIFGVADGNYGLNVTRQINDGAWAHRDELAATFLENAGHALNRLGETTPAGEDFRLRVAQTDIHVHANDISDIDVLTGPAFADYEGGFAAANAALGGNSELLHVDATQPEKLKTRTLEQEIARIVRMRLANASWLQGQMRHGYRGASEIAQGVESLYAFSASSGLVSNHHFDLLFAETLGNEEIKEFLEKENPRALEAIAKVFNEALKRDLWRPQRNSVALHLQHIGAHHGSNA